ncbi:hypothetical protein WICPIJ_005016 [Wickerhamomyces pijperi]|uniref:Uncharacterized protein n=1 Tax=Wickerhamomyces pijperi TaxID=599730 RepID=A0A9P8Q4M2_WICPI|nr:hypothetical protein WICPIJ_005016 [Wickerhamomyces pijperi]
MYFFKIGVKSATGFFDFCSVIFLKKDSFKAWILVGLMDLVVLGSVFVESVSNLLADENRVVIAGWLDGVGADGFKKPNGLAFGASSLSFPGDCEIFGAVKLKDGVVVLLVSDFELEDNCPNGLLETGFIAVFEAPNPANGLVGCSPLNCLGGLKEKPELGAGLSELALALFNLDLGILIFLLAKTSAEALVGA